MEGPSEGACELQALAMKACAGAELLGGRAVGRCCRRGQRGVPSAGGAGGPRAVREFGRCRGPGAGVPVSGR
eukprot:3760044-Alexandrium_andersonii.AAC.1